VVLTAEGGEDDIFSFPLGVNEDITGMGAAFIDLLKAFTMAGTTRALPLRFTHDYLFQYFQSL
jgi:hypothetical protein